MRWEQEQYSPLCPQPIPHQQTRVGGRRGRDKGGKPEGAVQLGFQPCLEIGSSSLARVPWGMQRAEAWVSAGACFLLSMSPTKTALCLDYRADLQNSLPLHLPSAKRPWFCLVPNMEMVERKGSPLGIRKPRYHSVIAK